MHGERFGVVCTEAPFPQDRLLIQAVAPKVAMMDAGMAWPFEALARASPVAGTTRDHQSR